MLTFVTCDVFTDQAFGGNPLAVVFGVEGLSTDQLQKIAFEFNYSETTFVLPPQDPANTAQVRIFTPGYEMPFAGHPNVGTGFVLARLGTLFGQALGDHMVFEEIAGLVAVDILRDDERNPIGARIAAPKLPGQPTVIDTELVARATGLAVDDFDLDLDPPILLEAGPSFILAALKSHEALKRAQLIDTSVVFPGDLAQKGVGVLLHCRIGAGDPLPMATRMLALDSAMS
ncbi:MAG: PhzF family phenazine biosynthesis protein, partial [Pseudomonadota bacterium]